MGLIMMLVGIITHVVLAWLTQTTIGFLMILLGFERFEWVRPSQKSWLSLFGNYPKCLYQDMHRLVGISTITLDQVVTSGDLVGRCSHSSSWALLPSIKAGTFNAVMGAELRWFWWPNDVMLWWSQFDRNISADVSATNVLHCDRQEHSSSLSCPIWL